MSVGPLARTATKTKTGIGTGAEAPPEKPLHILTVSAPTSTSAGQQCPQERYQRSRAARSKDPDIPAPKPSKVQAPVLRAPDPLKV